MDGFAGEINFSAFIISQYEIHLASCIALSLQE
jgi:hypothetical protein